jgi:hypothetical protein
VWITDANASNTYYERKARAFANYSGQKEYRTKKMEEPTPMRLQQALDDLYAVAGDSNDNDDDDDN